MSDSKIYMFGDERGNQNGFGNDLLTGALLGGGGFGGFGGGANWLLPFLLFALWGNNGWGGNGFGGRGFGNNNGIGFLSDQLNNDAGRELIMQAIQGNATAISQLASTLNCNVGEIRTAIGNLSTQICNLGNQMGMNTMQVIQAINNGNFSLQSQLAQCCCETQKAIQESNYLTERGFCNTNQILAKGFSDIGYETQRQTCDLQNTIKDSTAQILAGQAAIEKRELQREIDALREQKETYKLGSMITSATAPILQEVEQIKCKLPRTETVNVCNDYIPVNRSINVGYTPTTFCGNGFGFGNWSGWNNGCCGNGSLWG